MMYPRLKVAWTLLSEDGCIFISIDDHEVSRLRALCDEIFGEENFIATVIWQKVFSPKNTAATFSEDHDYVLAYGRHKDVWRPGLLERSEENLARYQNPDDDPRGVWMSGAIQARNYYSKGQYQVTSPSGKTFSNPRGTYWRVSYERFMELDEQNRIWWGENGDGVPRIKRFLSDVREGVVPQTLWKFEEVGHTQEAKEELLRFVAFEHSENVLNSLKPSRLIRKILRIATRYDESDIVLDFFAGSGTTGHAVMTQNSEDGGNRRYILVQMPEPLKIPEDNARTIFDLAKSRLRAVADDLRNSDAENGASEEAADDAGQMDLGFRVYSLDTSNIRAWEPDPDNLEQTLMDSVDHIRPGRGEHDILSELLLKLGLDLSIPIETRTIAGKPVANMGSGALIACLDESIATPDVERLAQGIADWRDETAPDFDGTVIFRDSAFTDDVAKANLAAILEQRGISNVRSL